MGKCKVQALTPERIIAMLHEHKDEIRKYGVKKIGIFGSFVKGGQRKESDMDFIVAFDEPTFDNYMDLKFMLERLFKRKVDLVIEDSLKPALMYVKEEAVYAAGV